MGEWEEEEGFNSRKEITSSLPTPNGKLLVRGIWYFEVVLHCGFAFPLFSFGGKGLGGRGRKGERKRRSVRGVAEEDQETFTCFFFFFFFFCECVFSGLRGLR